jgi:hypothetical protein
VVTAEIEDDVTNVVHQIQLTGLKTTADDVEGLPVRGMRFNVFQAVNIAALELDINSITTSDIVVGEEVMLADFDLEETQDNEDVVVRALTFEFGGSMDHQDDLSDITLYMDGVVIADSLMIDSDEEIVVTLDETIAADETVSFELKATVTGSVNDTLSVSLTEVYAVGADTGINASIS